MIKQKSLSDVLTIMVFPVFLILVSACVGSTEAPEPVGIGRDVDQYKKSPCACLELEQQSLPPGYLEYLSRQLES